MKGEKNVGEIRIENGVIVYYGSRAGQIRDGCAVIDPMFQVRELTEYLERQKDIRMIRIERGVYERLMNARSMEENQQALKKVRVWQLKPDVDVQMKFVPYDTLMRKFGPPDIENYEKVFEGTADTNDLEDLFEKFNMDWPSGYTGHSLSISDVLELYDEQGSEFYYVDAVGFRQVEFSSQQPSMCPSQAMQL